MVLAQTKRFVYSEHLYHPTVLLATQHTLQQSSIAFYPYTRG